MSSNSHHHPWCRSCQCVHCAEGETRHSGEPSALLGILNSWGWDWLDLGTSPVNPMLAVYTDPPLALHIHNRLGSETAQPTWTKQESNTLYQRFLENGGVWCLLFTEVPKVGVVTSGSSLGALSHMVGSITSKSSLSLTRHPYPTLTKPWSFSQQDPSSCSYQGTCQLETCLACLQVTQQQTAFLSLIG